VIFGNDLDAGFSAGFRGSLGMWFDEQQFIGLESTGFLLGENGKQFSVSSHSTVGPLLALTNYNQTGAAGVFLIAAPAGQSSSLPPAPSRGAIIINGELVGPTGNIIPPATVQAAFLSGGIRIHSGSQLWGTDTNFIHAFIWTPDFHLVGLAGVRYLDLDENISIGTDRAGNGTSALTFLGTDVGSQAIVVTEDAFHTRDQFVGGQLGLRTDYIFDRCFVGMSTLLAFGGTEETASIHGTTALFTPRSSPLPANGGLYALPSNSGQFRRDDFGFVPEIQVRGGVLLTPWCKLTVSYDFLYWSRVARPGNQIDLEVDARQVPTSASFTATAAPTSPGTSVDRTSFWMQGITLGLEFTY
jgi:hypothetical protein